MRKFIKKHIVKFALYLFYNNAWLRNFILERRGQSDFVGASASKMKTVEDKEKAQAFKKLNRLYRKRKYPQYIKFLNTHELWVKEEKLSKYFSWAALITKGNKESMRYIGEAINLHPIAVNDITTSIVISEYPNKTDIEVHAKTKALSSEQLTPLVFCYVMSKFGQLAYLESLIEKQYFSTLFSYEELLEIYALLNNNLRVVSLFENNKSKIFTPRAYERVYDAYTRLGRFTDAKNIFLEADQLYAPLKNTISPKVNPHVINNKLERHFWFAQGNLVQAYHTYKRQRLSQIMYVTFEARYTQSLQDIISAKSPLILASWGPGDEIRFAGLYHLLSELNPSLTVSCEPRLFALFSRMFPNINFLATNRTRRINENETDNYNQLPHAKLHHLMDNSLCAELDKFDRVTILTDLIGEIFELYAPRPQVNKLMLCSSSVNRTVVDKINQLKAQKKSLVGISWRSSIETASRNEHYYSIAELAPLFQLKNTVFVNLQYDDCSNEVKSMQLGEGSEFITLDIDQFNDFSTVLYLMQQLDVVVSAATTVLELAGLSGTDTYALTNHHALSSRVQAQNKDLWFANINYVKNMTLMNKHQLVENISKVVGSTHGAD